LERQWHSGLRTTKESEPDQSPASTEETTFFLIRTFTTLCLAFPNIDVRPDVCSR
jgi:hypothetical protein